MTLMEHLAELRRMMPWLESDTKVVPAGSASLSSRLWASLGPVLLTVTVCACGCAVIHQVAGHLGLAIGRDDIAARVLG